MVLRNWLFRRMAVPAVKPSPGHILQVLIMLRVYGYNGANSATVCYTLRVQLGTASKGNDLIVD